MTSILHTITAKSDQMNAEDLIGGARTIRVTNVRVNTSEEQPVWVYFEGDNGKPFKPCKTMRRLLIRVWGDDSSCYPGRAMTLYRDPNVKYGGMAVGGIRISHMSHIDEPRSFFLTETRGKSKKHTVNPIQIEQPPAQRPDGPTDVEIAAVLKSGFEAAANGKDAFVRWWNSDKVKANDSRARKIVNGFFPGTEVKLEDLQRTAVEADAKKAAQVDDVVEDPFSAKIPAE